MIVSPNGLNHGPPRPCSILHLFSPPQSFNCSVLPPSNVSRGARWEKEAQDYMTARGFEKRQVRCFGRANDIIRSLGAECVHTRLLSPPVVPAAWTATTAPLTSSAENSVETV